MIRHELIELLKRAYLVPDELIESAVQEYFYLIDQGETPLMSKVAVLKGWGLIDES